MTMASGKGVLKAIEDFNFCGLHVIDISDEDQAQLEKLIHLSSWSITRVNKNAGKSGVLF